MEGQDWQNPVWSWASTVAPTGLVFYTGSSFPEWKHQRFVASLSKGSLWRMEVVAQRMQAATLLLFAEAPIRLRKVLQSPQGQLYLLSDEQNGRLIQIKNANATHSSPSH
ncbi:MAG: PQQ-dependent sugar dehydrogenase [Bacteroidota bacterium]